MKLLLTSGGITNQQIAAAFFKLVAKPPSEIKLAYIPTAANVEPGNKVAWFFRQYEDLRQLGLAWIDWVDFAAADIDWRSRLDACDVLYLTGGNTFYLLDQIRKTGFAEYLQQALSTKIYVGGSASSITMTPSIEVANLPPGDPNVPGLKDLTGLRYVGFEIEPHCDTARFARVEQYAATRSNPVYAIDDQSAIQVVDDRVTVVSDGDWRLFK